ncbi:MAG: autotransporter-associated beta strand repeat-containing protein [Pirellulales bacterium]|nr:autotransporter-associated beta strand repeat-containing protein [Pirellulales bacterium]
MHSICHSFAKLAIIAAAAVGVLAISNSQALAQSGVWTNPANGDYNTPANWQGGVIAGGAGATADFSTLDINSDVSVTLDAPLTVGHLRFADTNTATGGSWELRTTLVPLPTITLDNNGSAPTITVDPLVPATTFDDAFVAHNLAGTAGVTKLGDGILTLGQGATHTITGGINVNAGTLRLLSTVPGQAINIGNEARLRTGVTLDFNATPALSHTINVASGATANIAATTSVELGNIDADGATLNLNVETAGSTLTADNNWALAGSAAAVNVTSAAGGFLRLRINGGGFNGGASFQNSHLSLDNITTWTRTNSGGNTVNVGALSGTSTAILSGGGQGGGTFANYSVGTLNTNTAFAGTIDTTSAPAAPAADTGGLNLTKVGTGTLTLSGTLSYQPNGNSNTSRRGGITTVSDGVLKLTNSAAIPGGIVHGTAGNVLSTVNVVSPGTLDVSGYTAGAYSTAALQQVIGNGTIVGNYNHDEGFLRPGNTITGTNPLANAVGGTLNFANTLSFAGSGTVQFDLTPNTASGNDLLQVNGANLTGSPNIEFNFLGGVPSGTYTLLNSTTPLTGNTAGWNIVWAGRGTAPTLTQTSNLLNITVSAGAFGAVSWNGNNGTAWDVNTTTNWVNNTTDVQDKYFQGDTVTFADAHDLGVPAATTVTLDVAVTPSAVVVNNTALSYSITGSGKITGSTGLTKQGTGQLILQTANDFTGATSIQGGTVDIGNFNTALGSGNLAMSGGKIIAANATAVGLTNPTLSLTGSANIIEANGSTNSLGLPGMTGDGDLSITTTVTGKLVDLGSNNVGFTGDLNIAADGVLATGMNARLNGAGSSLPNSVVTLTNGASLRDRATSVQTIELGALAGDGTSNLMGYQGGSGATAKTWRIGALGVSTVFAGTIVDGAGSSSTTAATNITKVGAGALTLSGVNTYTGDTSVEAGTLSITNPYLADLADVRLLTGAIFNLNFAATDVIDSIFLNGISQAIGTYGAVGSGATFQSVFFTGTGLLQVTTMEAAPIPGDFDGNGFVDGADLAQWRGDFRAAGSDADADGDSDGNDFLIWQRNLGAGTPPPSTPAARAVPEPASWALCVLGIAAAAADRRRKLSA